MNPTSTTINGTCGGHCANHSVVNTVVVITEITVKKLCRNDVQKLS